MEKLYTGIDIGGTAIKVGLLNGQGAVLCSDQVPTDITRGPEGVLTDALGLVAVLLSRISVPWQAVAGVGMGVPGMVDGTVVTEASNLGWDRVDLQPLFAKLSPIPLRLANDADAAALGEVRLGGARGMKNAFLLTLGTGLGGGIILNSQIYSGNHGFGGELGHVCLVSGGRKCCCGRRGCAEQYLSAPALVREAKRLRRRYPDSVLNGSDTIRPKDIFDHSHSDPCCGRLVEQYTRRLSQICLDIANAFCPEAIMLGGGMSLAGEKLTVPVQRELDTLGFARVYGPRISVLSTKLGNDAGFIGAACLWL